MQTKIDHAEITRLAKAKLVAAKDVDSNRAAARSALEAYWAGSATACVLASYRAGHTRTVVAK